MRLSRSLREGLTDLWLVGPSAFLMMVLIFIPVALVTALSFTDYQFGARSFNWVGLSNYIDIFSDPNGRKAVLNTAIYALIVIPFSVGFGLLAAIGLHNLAKGWPRAAALLRTAYFLPVAATLVAMATVWQVMLHPTLGIVNHALEAMGLSGRAWLSDRSLVLYTLAVIGIWQTIGYNMVLFLAGLSGVPDTLYDAAEVDGASTGWAKFRLVTWPMLGPTTLFVMVITATTSLRVFETVATMTQGGPAFASDTLVYAMYREGFVYFRGGYAAALTVIFFVAVLILTLAQFRVMEKRVHYK